VRRPDRDGRHPGECTASTISEERPRVPTNGTRGPRQVHRERQSPADVRGHSPCRCEEERPSSPRREIGCGSVSDSSGPSCTSRSPSTSLASSTAERSREAIGR
jgi:hypothetical protein